MKPCALVLVLALVPLTSTPVAGGEPARKTGDAGRPGNRPASAADTAQYNAASADDAIRIAVDAIDQLESARDDATRRQLIERIQRQIQTIERSAPGDPWLYYLHGRLYASTGRGIDAAKLLQQFVETRAGRNEWKAHRVLGDLFVGQYPRLARSSYETAARLKENEPTVLLGLSKCAYSVGDIDAAVRFARKAVDADKDQDVRYVGRLAAMLMAQQKWSEAQQVAERGLSAARASAQDGAETPALLASLDEQYRLLIDMLKRQSVKGPVAAHVYLDLSKYIRLQADNAARLARHDALRVLQEGVDATAPDTPVRLLERYAVALAEVGRRADAVARFEEIRERDAGNAVATEWLARLQGDGDFEESSP
ncbi:MAG: tetratricopeptide repeat protein [Phycisphaerae bacterium]